MPVAHSHFDVHLDHARREIAVRGEFDAATAPCLATAVADLQRAGPGDITILLDDVTFLDSAGMRAVADARTSQIDRGNRLGVTGATDRVRRIFGLVNFTGLLCAS